MSFFKKLFRKFEVRHRKKDKTFTTKETSYGDIELGINILACDMVENMQYHAKHSNIILTYIIENTAIDMISDMNIAITAMVGNSIRVNKYTSNTQLLYIISGSIQNFELLNTDYELSYQLAYNKPLKLILNHLKLFNVIGEDAFNEAGINDNTSISNMFSSNKPFFQPAPALEQSTIDLYNLSANVFDNHRLVYLADPSIDTFESMTYFQLNLFIQGGCSYTHYLDEIIDSCKYKITKELDLLFEEGENFISNQTIESLYDDIDEAID